jgi:hypothetical protein
MVVAWSCSVLLALFAQAPDLAPSDLGTAHGKVRLDLEVLRAVDKQPLAFGQQVFAQELLYVDLTISIQKEFLEHQLMPLWRLPLDLQVELNTPWAEESASWLVLSNELNHGVSFVMDHEKSFLTRLPEQSDGWARFQLRQELVPTRLGAWKLAAAKLRFAWATRFEDDLVRGSIALDQQEAIIRSKEWVAQTVALPTAGRPQDFHGMVGRYTMEMDSKVVSTASETKSAAALKAEAEQESKPELALSNKETWQVRIDFRGKGYLQLPFAWQPEFGPGFALRGSFLENHSEGFTWVGEVQSSRRGAELPSVAWSYFDPTNGGHYETLHTPGFAPNSSSVALGSPARFMPWALGGGLLLAASAMLLLARQRQNRRQGQGQGQEQSQNLRHAPAPPQHSTKPSFKPHEPSASLFVVAQRLAPPPDLIDHLAELLRCRRDSVYAEDLLQRLHQAGLSQELAQELSLTVQVILRARFAEQGSLPSQQRLAELKERLKSHQGFSNPAP